ncbi:PDDEXK family nuclease [Streptomyces incanus]
MSKLIEQGAIPERYKVEVFDGRVIMTPQSPEQDWTVSDVKDAVKASGIAREHVFGDVLITFPGENDAAPDLTIVDFDAERRKNSYGFHLQCSGLQAGGEANRVTAARSVAVAFRRSRTVRPPRVRRGTDVPGDIRCGSFVRSSHAASVRLQVVPAARSACRVGEGVRVRPRRVQRRGACP